jgi:TRAP-type transport system periplasmic protein
MQTTGSFACTAAIVAMMSLSTPTHADPVVLEIGSPLVGPEHASSKAMEIFRTELARRTHGALGVAFPAEMKDGGSVRELVDGVHTGAIFALPFVFRNADHARRIVEGPVGKLIDARLNAKGFVPLAWMELGVREVTNAKQPLKTLEDFKGLRIRVQPSETHMAIFRALGAKPVAMDYGSVYTALKQGDIDAVESPYYPTYAAKLYEVEKYISDSGHIIELMVFIANRKTFTAFPPEQQEAIRDAARIAAAQEWKMVAESDSEALAALKANGMQFDPIPNTSRVAFRKAVSSVIDGVRKRVGAELVDQIVAAGRR